MKSECGVPNVYHRTRTVYSGPGMAGSGRTAFELGCGGWSRYSNLRGGFLSRYLLRRGLSRRFCRGAFTAVLLAALLLVGDGDPAASALLAAQRFLCAAAIAALPAALIFLLGLDGAGIGCDAGSAVPLVAAHRRC